jgi:hypothetical protein
MDELGHVLPGILSGSRRLVISGQSLALCLPLQGKVYGIFLGRGETRKFQVMSTLRPSTLIKPVSCVGKAYEIYACDCEVYIPFTIDSQCVRRVGTLRAEATGASWHGASERTIRKFKK